jgi:hypothetical protein
MEGGKSEIVGFSQPRREVQILKLQVLTCLPELLQLAKSVLDLACSAVFRWFHDPR